MIVKLPTPENEIVYVVDGLNLYFDDTLEQAAEKLFGVTNQKVDLLGVRQICLRGLVFWPSGKPNQKADVYCVKASFDDDLGGEQVVEGAQ